METRTIKMPNNLIVAEAIKWLGEGREVCLRAAGRSMSPYIKDGSDTLVLSRTDTGALGVGDVVLALTDQGAYVVHRIIAISGDAVTLKGDGNLYGTEQTSRSRVYGLLVAVERQGRRIPCNTPAQRLKAAVMRWCYQTPRKIRHRLGRLARALAGRK